MIRITTAERGEVSVRFRAGVKDERYPQDCPDGKEGFCFLCHEDTCHACQGYRWIETEHGDINCQECGGTGRLSAQLANAHDPEAAQAAYRAEKGWAP